MLLSSKYKLDLSESDAKELTKRFDRNRDGYVDYDAFAHWLSAADDIAQIEKKVQHYIRQLTKVGRDLRAVFNSFDEDRDDRLSRSDRRHTFE